MRPESIADELLDRAGSIVGAEGFLKPSLLEDFAREAIRALSSEEPGTRPFSASGEPGGLVHVKTPFVAIVPDLHARPSLLVDLLASSLPSHPATSLLDMALDGNLTIVCLGDILNSEGRIGADRWAKAALRMANSGIPDGLLGPEMDEEMGASMAALGIVMLLKSRLGAGFHCLKGNHDNITNTNLNGDAGFYKYALEGAMGAEWFRLRYGEDLMRLVRHYERSLPLVAAGRRFCASHAEPAFALGIDDLLDYRKRADVVGALIWTGNGQAAKGAVAASLQALLGAKCKGRSLWIAGHRSIRGSYVLRAGGAEGTEGSLMQIHNPERRQFAWIDNSEKLAPAAVSMYEVGKGGGTPALLDALDLLGLDLREQEH
ncbi:MAG: hypothetical protein WA234_04540 [Rectinemataceae bacterium]